MVQNLCLEGLCPPQAENFKKLHRKYTGKRSFLNDLYQNLRLKTEQYSACGANKHKPHCGLSRTFSPEIRLSRTFQIRGGGGEGGVYFRESRRYQLFSPT